jgi:hypothetical protein
MQMQEIEAGEVVVRSGWAASPFYRARTGIGAGFTSGRRLWSFNARPCRFTGDEMKRRFTGDKTKRERMRWSGH